MNSKISYKNAAIAASATAPTLRSATAGTHSANVSPSAPLLLRTATNLGLDRSRDQRPSSPVFSTLAGPPPHMRHYAYLWDSIANDIKREMLRIPFYDVERGLQEAKVEVAAHATELADSEHCKNHNRLVANKANAPASALETRTALTSLEQDIWECISRLGVLEVQERSATVAAAASSRTHQFYTADVRTHAYPEHQLRQLQRSWPPRRHEYQPTLDSIPGRHRLLPPDGQINPLLGPRSPPGDNSNTPTFPRMIPTLTSERRA